MQGEEKASGYFGYYLSSEDAKWPLDGNGKETYPYNVEQYKDNGKTKYREMTRVKKIKNVVINSQQSVRLARK